MAQIHGLPIDLQDDILQALCRQYGVARLALFGSVLRDDFTEQSDIDVLCILLPDSPGPRLRVDPFETSIGGSVGATGRSH